jgi:hypothetical protein
MAGGITAQYNMYIRNEGFYEVALFCEQHSGNRFVGDISGVEDSESFRN